MVEHLERFFVGYWLLAVSIANNMISVFKMRVAFLRHRLKTDV
jgi:hypothetical protein